MTRKALGRGLSALIPGADDTAVAAAPVAEAWPRSGLSRMREYLRVAIEDVHPSAEQPRKRFDEAALRALVESISRDGLLQPLLVRQRSSAEGGGFAIIAGERRWRAAQRAGLKEVPVVVKETAPREAFELALVENLQREDLNPIEEAEAYKRLIEEHGLTQEELAARVGKDRSTVANALRLLRLPEAIKHAIVAGQLSMGHARALLALADEADLRKAAEKVISEQLSVRAVEALVQRFKSKRLPKEKREPHGSAQVRQLVEKLQRKLGAKVELKDKGGSGTLEIRYQNLAELDRILEGILGN